MLERSACAIAGQPCSIQRLVGELSAAGTRSDPADSIASAPPYAPASLDAGQWRLGSNLALGSGIRQPNSFEEECKRPHVILDIKSAQRRLSFERIQKHGRNELFVKVKIGSASQLVDINDISAEIFCAISNQHRSNESRASRNDYRIIRFGQLVCSLGPDQFQHAKTLWKQGCSGHKAFEPYFT